MSACLAIATQVAEHQHALVVQLAMLLGLDAAANKWDQSPLGRALEAFAFLTAFDTESYARHTAP